MRQTIAVLLLALGVGFFAASTDAGLAIDALVQRVAAYVPAHLRHYVTGNRLPPYAILDLFAREAMDWERSTTAIPISKPSPLLKAILSRLKEELPEELRHFADNATVKVQDVRDYLNKARFSSLTSLCAGEWRAACAEQVNTPDPELGITPLHLAYASGDKPTVAWLLQLGANPDALDSAGRKPANLSFANFVKNSKRWAREAGRTTCDIPVVNVRTEADLAEVRRLVSEGEPVLIRGALPLLAHGRALLDLNLEDLVGKFSDAAVKIGDVPYADYFALPHHTTTLSDFYRTHVLRPSPEPLYVFHKHAGITEPGLSALGELIERAFPSPQIICPLAYKNSGPDSIHFFLGCANSGAPFHIHADAVNVITMGRKRWLLSPPTQALYSRKHIALWLKEDYAAMSEDERPLECVQEAGDIVYIPFDWGHATVNLELTFGYALELFNRRELFLTLPSHYQAC